jgi:hypothetical protein
MLAFSGATMLFKEWREFVIYPGDSGRVKSREQRLDTSKAFRIGADGQYPPEMRQCPIAERVAVYPLSKILSGGDTFECMEVSDYGHVYIWTRQKVWFIVHEGIEGRVEKLKYVPRHPPESC